MAVLTHMYTTITMKFMFDSVTLLLQPHLTCLEVGPSPASLSNWEFHVGAAGVTLWTMSSW